MLLRKLFFALSFLAIVHVVNGQTQTIKDTLIVAHTISPPFIIKSGHQVHGINIWLWKKIAKDLKLEYKFVEMELSEMLEALKTNRVDISITPLTITSQRSKYIEFTDSFFASNGTIAVSKQSSIQNLLKFIKGFFNENFLKGLIVLFSIIAFFGFLGWYFERHKNPNHFRISYKGIWDGLWWAAVTITTVGYGDKSPITRQGKIIALTLMFGGLLFISGLTASIASSLTVNRLSASSGSFAKFKDQSVGTIKNSSTSEFLKIHFFKKIKTYDTFKSGLIDLNNKKISAFIYDEPILKSIIKSDSTFSKIQILPIKFDIQFYAFGISKNKTALEKRISQRILEIIESHEWEIVLNEFGLSEL